MEHNNGKQSPHSFTANELGEAIYSVNRHAKTASDPKFLYLLKKKTITKMIKEGKAKKLGLQYSNHPHLSYQQSDLLIQCGDYTFHIPPVKEDFETLPHLGHLTKDVRNPQSRLALSKAKKILTTYTGIKEESHVPAGKKSNSPKYCKPIFTKLGEGYPYRHSKRNKP